MKSLKINFALNSANQLLSIIVPLITTPYLSRILGAEMLGVFSYANSVAYYFTLFGMLGLSNYGGREIAKVRYDRKRLSVTFSGIYTAQMVSSVIVLLIYLLYMLVDGGLMSKIYFINIFAVLFDINWLYYGLEKFEVSLKRNFFVKLVSTICIFIFVNQPEDVYIYAFIMVVSGFLGNLLLWNPIRKEITFSMQPGRIVKKHLLSNLTLFLPLVLTSVYKVMDKLMLRWMSSYTQVGFYECADKLGQVPLYLISSLSQIMIPRISFLSTKDSDQDIKNYLYKGMMVISLLATTVIFGIIGVANEFVPAYFGEGYDYCINLIKVLLPSYIFTGYASTLRSQLLIPYGKDKEFGISLAAGAACNAALNLLLIPHFEALGAAFATAVTELVVCLITVMYIGNNISWKRIFLDNIKFYISGAIMLIVLSFISNSTLAGLILKIAIGAIVYITVFAGCLIVERRGKKDGI